MNEKPLFLNFLIINDHQTDEIQLILNFLKII